MTRIPSLPLRIKRTTLLLVVGIVGACQHALPVAAPAKGIPVQEAPADPVGITVHRHRLPNGLTVLHRPRPGSGVVALQVWVRVGSADEAPSEIGLAHVHEHMLFRGTKAYDQGEIDATVAALGGEINAWTSFDETVYHIVLPAAAAETGMNLLAELLQRPKLAAEDLGSELEVVQEEIRQDQDAPGRKLSQALFARVYGADHPYGRDVAGDVPSVARLNDKLLKGFFDRYYAPQRSLLVIDGDVDEAQAKALVDRAWAGWSVPEASAEVAVRPAPASGSSVTLLREPVAQAHFGFAFNVERLDAARRAHLALLATLLGQGESSLLVRQLQYERQLVNGIFSYGFDPAGPGLLVVGGVTDGGRLRDAIDGVVRSLARIAHGGVDEDALLRARAQLLAQVTFQNETVQDEASRIAHFELLRGDWAEEARERELLRTATPADLQALAGQLIAEERQHLVAVMPEGTLPDFTKDALEAVSRGAWAAVKSELSIASTLPKPDARGRYSLTLPSGVQVVLWPKADAPVTAINVAWRGGQLLEDEGSAGLHALLGEVLPQASERYAEVELAQRIDRLGASLSAFPGRSSFALRGEVIAEHFDEFLGLFIDVLKRPRVEATAVDRERGRLLEQVRSRDDRPAQKAYGLGLKALFGEHPYGLALDGEEEPLRHIDAQRLREHYFEHYAGRPPTVVVVGCFDPKRLLARLLTTFPPTGDQPALALAAEAVHRPAEGEQPQRVPLKRSQVQVVRTVPGIGIGDEREPVMMLLLEILGGSSGRLFQSLREERGLTYGVSADAVIGLRGGALAIHYSTAPERLDESLQALDATIGKLISVAPTEDEVARARRYLQGVRVVGRQTAIARSQELVLDVLYGLGLDHSDGLHQALEAVTPEQIRALAESLFVPSKTHTLLLGPIPEPAKEGPALSRR